MDLPVNRFKQGLASGEFLYGLWLGLPNNTAAEIAASAGFDWLVIDHEHAPFEISDVLTHLQVIAAYDVAAVVRPVSGDPKLLKKLLDIGVQSFVVPMVETAEQARAIVDALHYPPRGSRGVGTALARGAQWNQIPDYLHKANDEICLIVQAETALAMDNLDDILAVDGVDGVFIGPSDLAASMGHIGDTGNPEVVESINNALQRIAASGKSGGMFCLNAALLDDYRAKGASFAGIGLDTLILAQGSRALLQQFKSGHTGQDSQAQPQAGY